MRTISEAVKQEAIKELTAFIEYKTLECMGRGWAYRPTDQAPETFGSLKERSKDKVLPIANYGCDQSIYGNPDINIKFRFWHDVTHLELDSGFSEKGESIVIDQHLKEGKEYGLSPLAMDILEADTIGQVKYYFHHKEFVQNQAAFIDTCLQLGIRKAVAYKH